MNIYREEQKGEGPFSIQRYNLSLSTCKPKYELSVLYSCGDIFDEKYGEKKKEQIQERTNRRRLILNPTIQLAIVNLYTKYIGSFYLKPFCRYL